MGSRARIPQSCFPADAESEEGQAWSKICGHCRRFLPHQSSSGGFFVAVLEKVSETVPASKRPDDTGYDVGSVLAPTFACETATDSNVDVVQGDNFEREGKPRKNKKVKAFVPVTEYELVRSDDASWVAAAERFGLDHMKLSASDDTEGVKFCFRRSLEESSSR